MMTSGCLRAVLIWSSVVVVVVVVVVGDDVLVDMIKDENLIKFREEN